MVLDGFPLKMVKVKHHNCLPLLFHSQQVPLVEGPQDPWEARHNLAWRLQTLWVVLQVAWVVGSQA